MPLPLLDNLKNAFAMPSEIDEFDDYEIEDEYVEEERVRPARNQEVKETKRAPKVAAFPAQRKKTHSANAEIKSIKPVKIDEASLITDELLDGNSVIINLTNVDIVNARQILDFTSGSVYAIGGTLKKVTDSIFVAVPQGVNIDGTFDEKPEVE